MITLKRTTAENPNFIELVAALDVDLGLRDGKDHAFYAQFNSIEELRYTIISFSNEKPTGCGALKKFDSNSMEVKRMYVVPESRGKGIGIQILNELENWTSELGYKSCILETGKRQPEAISLYKKQGYCIIPNYGQYEGIENSICFKKEVSYDKNQPK